MSTNEAKVIKAKTLHRFLKDEKKEKNIEWSSEHRARVFKTDACVAYPLVELSSHCPLSDSSCALVSLVYGKPHKKFCEEKDKH